MPILVKKADAATGSGESSTLADGLFAACLFSGAAEGPDSAESSLPFSVRRLCIVNALEKR